MQGDKLGHGLSEAAQELIGRVAQVRVPQSASGGRWVEIKRILLAGVMSGSRG